VNQGEVLVIRYEGPKGGPGMREMVMATWMLVELGLDQVGCHSDGWKIFRNVRRSCVGHLVPEAMVGGPIAVLRDGDIIEIDIPARTLSVDLSDEQIRQRLASWKPPEPKVTKGYLAHFCKARYECGQGRLSGVKSLMQLLVDIAYKSL